LYRLAQLYDKTGKTSDAIASFRSLKEKYPQTMRGQEADKYLAKLGDTSN